MPSPPASVSPTTISFSLSSCCHHRGTPSCSCYQSTADPSNRSNAALGVSPSCGLGRVSVPLTKLRMSPRSCGAGRAGARSSRASSRWGSSMLAMVGSLVPSPLGWRALYSGRLHQLTWLFLSHPKSWHWGSAATPCWGQEGSAAQAARPCHHGASPGDHPALAMPACPLAAPLAKVILKQRRSRTSPGGGGQLPALTPLLPGCLKLWSWGSPRHPPGWALLMGSRAQWELTPWQKLLFTPRSSMAQVLGLQTPRNPLEKAQSAAGVSPLPCQHLWGPPPIPEATTSPCPICSVFQCLGNAADERKRGLGTVQLFAPTLARLLWTMINHPEQPWPSVQPC